MIPLNPLTIIINGALIDAALKTLKENYLPNYDIQITSGYRSIKKNLEIGGAQDSAHLYNLARDFVLVNKTTGNILSDNEMKNVYDKFIAPYWKGWGKFSPKQPDTDTGWIHLNLDRSLTDYVKWIAAAGTAAGFALGAKKLYSHFKLKLKGR